MASMIKPEDVKSMKHSLESGRVVHRSSEDADMNSKAWKTGDGKVWGCLDYGNGEMVGRITYFDSNGSARVFEHSVLFLPSHMKELFVQFYAVLCQIDGTDPFVVLGPEWKRIFKQRARRRDDEDEE